MKKGLLAGFIAMICLTVSVICVAPPERAYAAGYSIYVNSTTNTVTVYSGGTPIKVMPCSTGVATPRSGAYAMSSKYRWHALDGGVYGQYCTRITGHILFHSVPYTQYGNPASLKPGYFDLLGQSASAGCVRLMVRDCKWIYDNCPSGTTVVFYTGGDPGPLGYARTYKIGSAPSSLTGWDPTDPDCSNPWYTSSEFSGSVFNSGYYNAAYSDLGNAFGGDDVALRIHWITCGINEARRASDEFSISVYKNNYADLRNAFGNDNYAYVRHYVQYGKNEGRSGKYVVGVDINTDGSIIAGSQGTMYRLYNPNSGEHFYTASVNEANSLKNTGWSYESYAWNAPTTGNPVYRLYNPNGGDHHYTLSAVERDNLVSLGWSYEGIGWYSGGSKPLYRAYNPNATSGSHHFTLSYAEIQNICSAGWQYEGIAWYSN